MTASFTTEGLQTLFLYPFKDPRWKQKLLVGSIFTFLSFIVPIIPFLFVYGYGAQIMRRIIVDGEPPSLPEWEDVVSLAKTGLKVFGAVVVYLFPFFILFVLGYVAFVVPQVALGIAEEKHRHISTGLESLLVVGMLGGFGCFGLGILGALVVGIILPPAVAHVVATDSFLAAFKISGWWPIFRANLGGFIVSYIVLLGLSFASTFAFQILYFTVVLCCLLPFVLSFFNTYLTLIAGVLFAQAYRGGVQNLSSPPH